MKSLLLINVLLSLLIASSLPLFSGNPQPSVSPFADELVQNIEATSVSEGKVKLSWNMDSSGIDLIFFVQKSNDGVHFYTFGSLRASSSKSYAFFDHFPEKNRKVYYRIKVESLNGKRIKKLSRPFAFTHVWDSRLHSIQGDNFWTFNLPKQMGEKASLQIMNSMGQMVLKQDLSNIFSRSFDIPISGLNRGTYIISLISGDNSWNTRLIKN